MTASISDRTVFSWSFLISGIIIGFLLWLIYIINRHERPSGRQRIAERLERVFLDRRVCSNQEATSEHS